MTTQTLTRESEQLALELHALLHELDPSRWRAEREEALRQGLEQLDARLGELLQRMSEQADQRMETLRQRLLAMEALLRGELPPREPDASAQAPLRPSLPSQHTHEGWMRFRQRAVPMYEELASSLKALDMRVPSLRPTNYTRNLFHVGIAAGCIGVVQWAPTLTGLGFWLVVIIAWSFALTGWGLEIGRRKSQRVNALCMSAFKRVAHPHEAHHVNSSTWYTSALALLTLTHSPMICAVALAVLGVADPAAALVGKRWGKRRLANGRSIEGTSAFVLAGGAASMLTLATLHPQLGLGAMAALSLSASLVGGLVELNLRRVDDNLAVPVSAALAALAAAWLLGVPLA